MPTLSLSPETFQTFGDILKYLRRRERLTQLELSIKVGYSEAQISRLEQNQRLPDLAALKALFIPALHLENELQLTARFLELAQSAREEDAPFPGVAPYKGLLFFDEADADLFFGREALTAHLADRITDLVMDTSTRFLAIVGASGSGKSSLVRAGLSVMLKRAGWETHIFTPTASPLKALAANYNAFRAKNHKDHLIIVDQFEEIFTLCHDENERTLFIERLLSIARNQVIKTMIVIALRADFYSHCAQYPLLREVVATRQEYIGQMTADELHCAIEEPAKRSRWEFEPGLVDLLVNDIGADGTSQPEPGALPLLSHALLATWERRRGRTFTIEGYHASGGVRGAIAETAESVFTDQLNRVQQDLARDIFLRLTELGEGTQDTGRRATLTELTRHAEEATQLRDVLNTLADARLITLNEDSAEVAHEALIREWDRLHEWLNQDREGLRLHRHLTRSAQEWETRGRDPAELYRGTRLAKTSEWASAHEEHLNASERAFISASVAQEQHRSRELEAQQRRELEAAQKLAKAEQRRAEEQTQSAQQMRQLASYLAGAFIIMLVMACIALSSSNRSDQNALAALNAHETAVANTDNAAKLFNTMMGKELLPVSGHATPSSLTAYSPNGKMVAAISEENIIIVWDAESGDQLATLVGHTSRVSAITFSPDGTRLASSSFDGSAIIWDIARGKPSLILKGHTEAVESIAFSPDGEHVATVSDDRTAIIWDVTTEDQMLTLLGDSSMRDVTYSPDGIHIATANLDGSAIIWDASTGKEVLILRGHSGAVVSVTFSPDGKWLATVSIDGTAKIWDTGTGNILYEFAR